MGNDRGPSQPEGHRLAFELANWVPKADREALPIYTAVGRLAPERGELLAAFDHIPLERNHPGLLFGAVHYLLLEGAQHPLAEVFPTVRWFRGMDEPAAPLGTEEGVARFFDFLGRFTDQVRSTMETHEVQTNEVGRLAYLSPAIAEAQLELGHPGVLVDLGCSAGLNLAPHLATTTYVAADGSELVVGDQGSSLQLRSELRGSGSPGGAQAPSHALGIDLQPVHLAVGDAARWLLALTWAEDLARFQRTSAAIAAQREASVPPELVAASMVEVDEVLAGRFGEEPVVVVNSWSAAYLSREEQEALTASVQRLAATRPVRWVVAEHPKTVPGIPVEPLELSEPGATAIFLLDPATPSSCRLLGETHPHGRWLRWEA